MLRFPLLSFLLLFYGTCAQAALGGLITELGSEGRLSPSAKHQLAQPSPGIQQQTVITPQNVRVTEFAAGSVVFAIVWEGAALPDFTPLLGKFFPEYATGLQSRSSKPRNGPLELRTGTLVVHAQGHMRAFSGSAYAPALVPSGLSLPALGVEP